MTVRQFSAFGTSVMFHVSIGLCLVWTVAESVSRSGRSAAAHQPPSVFAASPAENPALPGLNPDATSLDDAMIRRGEDAPTLSVPGFTFDIRKIGNHATLLFPFLAPGLRLEFFGLTARTTIDASQWRAATDATLGGVRENRPPLALSDTAVQALMDASWSRRDRWTAFQHVAELTQRYSPTNGQLPAVLHAYLDQDGLEPYVDTTIPDPRLWAELGIAADHVRFIGFISRYAEAHRSTETTTELLLLLDACAQANLDALVSLVNTDLRGLQWTRRANRSAYDLIADSYAAVSADILTALRESTGNRQRDDINRSLDREHGRWISRSFDRLRAFGFRFDTF